MIAHGDELGRTQQGNNNVYCQDNELAWVDWDLDEDRRAAGLHPRPGPACARTTRSSAGAGSSRAAPTTAARRPAATSRGSSPRHGTWQMTLVQTARRRPHGLPQRSGHPDARPRGDASSTTTSSSVFNAHHEEITFTLPGASTARTGSRRRHRRRRLDGHAREAGATERVRPPRGPRRAGSPGRPSSQPSGAATSRSRAAEVTVHRPDPDPPASRRRPTGSRSTRGSGSTTRPRRRLPADLGVSPRLPVAGAPGGARSMHGYDVLDHTRISEEAGGRAAFERLVAALPRARARVVVDVVPNHMTVPEPAHLNARCGRCCARDAARRMPAGSTSTGSPRRPPPRCRCSAARSSRRSPTARSPLADDGGPVGTSPCCATTTTSSRSPPGTEDLPLAELVDRQWYRLAHWRAATSAELPPLLRRHLLVAVRVEDPEVFDATHARAAVAASATARSTASASTTPTGSPTPAATSSGSPRPPATPGSSSRRSSRATSRCRRLAVRRHHRLRRAAARQRAVRRPAGLEARSTCSRAGCRRPGGLRGGRRPRPSGRRRRRAGAEVPGWCGAPRRVLACDADHAAAVRRALVALLVGDGPLPRLRRPGRAGTPSRPRSSSSAAERAAAARPERPRRARRSSRPRPRPGPQATATRARPRTTSSCGSSRPAAR